MSSDQKQPAKIRDVAKADEYSSRGDPSAASVRVYVPRVVAVEHFDGDGRIVDHVWQTYHWLGCLPGQLPPDQIDPVAELVPVVPDCIYNESGRALR